ncbi:tetratricopeptide repeat protein [Arthrospiribacter ruber]|uniref:Ribonuclease R winged-helix domain-containing protein n=1 Tax=Arthrospiribacter ruber TaxID=2487934 RepID=A0A951IV70_9BACT|nr:winged-helix domain-containing protein [Arthrospiribacter ruber]MBW3466874.1 hypothetical protein [Arthrospiribacter ruber]
MSVKTLYNPAGLEKPELIDSFVVRTKTFEKIFSDIRSSDMKYPEKHYLIQGQRGMGKTTLLLRLKYEIENSDELNSWLLPVFFGEEAYDLTSLSRLWEKLLDYLDDALDTNGEHFEHTEDFIDFEDYEKRCFDYLIEILQKNKKKLVIFFDNFGQLFLDNLKEKERRRLREILMHCSEIRIIGASAIVLQDLHDYSEPFYEFFQIVRLEGLTKEETFHLIEKLQEKSNQKINLKKAKGKIDTLAILTGGVIRTLMMVYQVLLEDQDGSALNDLETILDQITPLYKSRIEELPVQQRRVVDVIAKNWDAISARDIATQIREDGKRIQTKLVSAHLAQLEKNNVIEKKQTNTKNHLYQVRERFFNIWYLMRIGDRKDRRRVKWLTKFLEVWYDDEESIQTFMEKHILRLKSGAYNSKSALLLVEALSDINKINPIILDQIMEETFAILKDDQKPLLNMGQKKLALATKSYNSGDLKKAIYILEKINDRLNIHRFVLSFFYYLDKKLDKIRPELLSVNGIEVDDLGFLKQLCFLSKDPDLMIQVLSNSPKIKEGEKTLEIGNLYFDLELFELAEKYFLEAIKLGEETPYKALSTIFLNRKEYTNAEEILESGFKSGRVEAIDLLEFYEFEFEGESEGKFSEYLKHVPKESPFYNFYHGIKILKTKNFESKEFLKAEQYLENALLDFERINVIDVKFTQLISYLLLINMRVSLNKDKLKGLLEIFEKTDIVPPFLKIYGAYGYIILGDYKKASELIGMDEVVYDSIEIDGIRDIFNDTLLLLMSKVQYHSVFKLFSENEVLKEVLKPTYYALMTLLKEEYPNEVVKMGEELTQPVNDILLKIEEMKLKYD